MRTTRERYEKDPYPNNRTYFNELVVNDRVTTWRGFHQWVDQLQDSWVFRGQAKAAWDLETTLDRHTSWEIKNKTSYLYERHAADYERKLLSGFQLRAHHYMSHPPGEAELMDWLALMQHYGGPTRLLDWTRSPYVALYFAVREGDPGKRSAAVWAIDRDWIRRELAKKFDTPLSDADWSARVSNYSNDILRKQLAGEESSEDPKNMIVVPATPKRENERMAAQQGVFLCNLNLVYPLDSALMRMIKCDDKSDKPPVRKLIVGPRQQIPFLRELKRMNISAASLFPDLEGFTRSLGEWLEIQVSIDIQQREQQDREAKSALRAYIEHEQDP